MDRTAFHAWLARYVDAWRLNDPTAIGDLFSPDVRYAFDPFSEAVVGRPAVVAAWLANPDEPGSWEADYEVLAVDGDTYVAHGRTRYLTDDRSTVDREVCQRLRLPVRRRGPLPRVHRVVHAPAAGGAAGLNRTPPCGVPSALFDPPEPPCEVRSRCPESSEARSSRPAGPATRNR